MAETLVCIIDPQGQEFIVRSPVVGAVRIHFREQNIVSEYQEIADVIILGKRKRLVLPKGIQGQIKKLFSNDQEFCVEYKQELMVIAPITEHSRAEKLSAKGHQNGINATMDGLFYLSPSPKSPSFVSVGQEIQPGQTIGLVEVMKCFYPMKYQGTHPVKVVDILVNNATPVQSGMRIFLVE